MRKVIVEFKDNRYSPIPSEEMTEIGVLYDNGQVLVADDLGSVSIHNCTVHPQKPDWVIVDRINDDKDYSEEDPEYIVNLIISGGAM
jgi:hypothetical protein